ncbi:reverse transcriptase domain-containing protein [Chelativorans salis]|uniref:Reverse transcriptase domain-containing protein n=1 Tax=Chelativorans salis TaxID=2978478 RepID=A0ABT2LKQ5_9HYPH|nr:reverse transcriptase domain-containing protein [Chelativorans sp. EGI FJ00035]MCT7374851.1 reverse transcriptase domain-containing protein [Chelativorans sp. EGI FJ00035]
MGSKEVFAAEFSTDRLVTLFNERIEVGSKALGKDGINVEAFKAGLDREVEVIRRKIFDKSYRFTGYKQRLISKGATKYPREISVATVRDRLVLRALCNVLMQIFPETLLPAPQAYVREISELLDRADDGFSFVQIDIKDFYPSIRHDLMLRRVRAKVRYPPMLKLIEEALKTPTGLARALNSREKGIPQGLSISNILSSIYMNAIDGKMKEATTYFRYVDDILIICPDSEASRLFRSTEGRLKAAGLECHSIKPGSKSKIASTSESVDYLGYKISKNMISVRSSSFKRMIDNIIKVITEFKYKKNHKRLILRINLKITGCIIENKRYGWMFFFSQTRDMSQLARLDAFIAKHVSKFSPENVNMLKTYIKTFHEIRYNIHDTKYVPKYDKYSFDQKVKMISELYGTTEEDIRSRDEQTVENLFRRLVKREISELEKDLAEAFS